MPYQSLLDALVRSVDGAQGAVLMDSEGELGAIRHVLCRYSDGHVMLRPLKDGYYLVLSLAPAANLGQALHRSADTEARVNAEL
jgi:predicted regulator of Ras-like GTPase activity (Roadblock/LC7/MglB family)